LYYLQRDSGSAEAELINNIILEGKIVPGDITINLIKKAMQKRGWNTKRFLIDGFPRNSENQEGWVRIMGDDVDMRFVLFLDCSEEKMIERICKRGEASGDNKRNDDNMEVLQKRFGVFQEQSMPIVKMYEERDQVRKINANQDPDAVYEEIKKAFDGYL